MKNKSAVSLPINIVVMMIIGIIIFALGMTLFSNIYQSGDETLTVLQNNIRNDIQALECDGDQWLCTPNYKMTNGDEQTFTFFISNHDQAQQTFIVDMDLYEDSEGKSFLNSTQCGLINILALKNYEITVQSGRSAQIPFIARSTRVSKIPCSFITTATLKDSTTGLEVDRTSVIIRVE